MPSAASSRAAQAMPSGRGRRPNQLERLALLIGLEDGRRHGCAALPARGTWRARLYALLRTLTGIEPPRPLADPRLETLRRLACAARLDGAVKVGDLIRLASRRRGGAAARPGSRR